MIEAPYFYYMKTKEIIILVLIGVVVYLYQCRKPKIKEVPKEVRFTDTIFKTDTFVNYIYKEHKDLQPNKVIKDTSRGIDLSDTNVFWRYWVYNITDSLLEAKITAHSQTRPSLDFQYTLKNFTIKDTIIIKDSVHTFEKAKNHLYFGAEVSGSQNRFGFSPSFTFSQKKGINYSLRYDLLNKEIGAKIELKIK